jgi:surface antigen
MPRLVSAGLVGIVVAGGAAGWAGTGNAAPAGDPRDQPYLSVVVNQALETERTNVEIPWSNPETAHRGAIVIERTFYRDPRTPCREYRRTTERPGERPGEPAALIRGTGCRIGPAVWSLDEADAPPETATAGTSAPDVTSSGTTTSGTVPGTPAPAATGQPAPPRAGKPAPKTAGKPAPKTAAARSAPRTAAGPRSAEAEKAPSLPSYTLPSKTGL